MSVVTINSHSLAKELLNKPDGFVTVTVDNREYMITDIIRKSNHANLDDWGYYYTLNCTEGEGVNIKR